MKRLAILIGLLLPLSASALEYRNLGLLYTDAPFTPAESAGISVLTSLHAVSGYPDGTFRPNRTLNRAEFLKIVLASYPKVRVSPSDADNCFPDVHREDWFSQYVCLAKKRGMVSGYPDGSFQPARPVNYAEALKMLGELYKYVAYSAPDEEWYAGYVRAAEFHKTALPSSIKYDRSLTRGQMARLAAAYRAKEDGELETYRLAEKSLDLVIAQEIAKNAQQSSSASSSSDSSVSSVASESSFSATSHFLPLGESRIIATGVFRPRNESVTIENVTVQLREEETVIAQMYLTDATGHRITELKADTADAADRTWKSLPDMPDYVLPPEGKPLGIEVVIKEKGYGGVPEELLQVKWVSMNVVPTGGTTSYQVIPSDTAYPAQQTAAAQILSVRNNRPSILDIGKGQQVLLAEFEVRGTHGEGNEVRVQHTTFTITDRKGVILSDFVLGALHTVTTVQCSTEGPTLINCSSIPASLGLIEHDSIILQVYGNVDIDESAIAPTFRIDWDEPGTLSTSIQQGTLGHLRWTDGQGAYNWVELDRPIAKGSVWK